MDRCFLVWILRYGEVDDASCCDCFREEDGGEFDLVVVLGEEDGHSCIQFADCELHFRGSFRGHRGGSRTSAWERRVVSLPAGEVETRDDGGWLVEF